MNFLSWLFHTRAGVGCLFGAGILLFLFVAFVLELKSRKLYFNHERDESEDGLLSGLFDDDVVEKAEAEAQAKKARKK